MTHKGLLALIGFLFVFSAAFSLTPIELGQSTTTTSSSSSPSTSAKMTLTVYPDGSIGIVASGNVSSMQTPGTLPNASLSVHVTTSGSQSTMKISGSATVPESELGKPPLSFSNTLSASGSFTGETFVGDIAIQAVPGVNSPLSSLGMTYTGNSTTYQVKGSNTLAYGTYETSSGPITLNESSIKQYIEMIKSEGGNQSGLNAELASLPFESEVNLQVSDFTLTPSYGANSATFQLDFVLTGNFTALPGALATYDCQEAQLSSTFCSEYSSLTESSFSPTSSGSYILTYANGVLSYNGNVTGPQDFNLDKMLQTDAKLATGLTPSERTFLNTTTVDITGFYMTMSSQQEASGAYSAQFSAGGLTIHPSVSVTDNKFNESGFLQVLGTSGAGNYTIEGGSNQAGSVSFSVPQGTPTPTSSKSNTAYWSNVNSSDLAGIQFSVEAPVQTTSSSSTSSSSSSTSSASTTSSTSSSSSGEIPEFPVQFLAVAVFTTLVVASYLVARRGHRIP